MAKQSHTEPKSSYQRRLKEREGLQARLSKWDHLLSVARIAVFLAGLAVVFLAASRPSMSWALVSLPVVAFIALLFIHERLIRWLHRARMAVSFYRRGLDRILERWHGEGSTGEIFPAEDHPYARDLDVFGEGSLFQLICTARTQAGEATLASWLSRAAPVAEVNARQEAVKELKDRLDLRERLALLGAGVRADVAPDSVTTWATGPVRPIPLWARLFAFALSIAAVISACGWIWWGFGPLPLLGIALVEMGFAAAWSKRVKHIVEQVEGPARDLEVLAQALDCLQREDVQSKALLSLKEALQSEGGLPPSRQVARLLRLAHLLDARNNQFFLPISFFLLWTTQIAFAVESWRADCGKAVSRWLDVLGRFEALCALAGYHYEHPQDPFPEVVELGPRFEGQGLGHPLLPMARCVRNDVRLGLEGETLMLVSGSNMSGKSTLLRTVGLNTVLALAGAPVRAHSLSISPLVVGASIRVNDSIHLGVSRFYAEILRLRQIMELATGRVHLLFLLDEILHGTNSHDRKIGGEAVLRRLVQHGALGLVTTHDLALTAMVDSFGDKALNVHFRDRVEDGHVVFDYLMYPGVVTQSNALELMRSIGLEV